MVDLKKAVLVWEKAFAKKMTLREKIMFEWGYNYAVSDAERESVK